jgi:hypothetical protein
LMAGCSSQNPFLVFDHMYRSHPVKKQKENTYSFW